MDGIFKFMAGLIQLVVIIWVWEWITKFLLFNIYPWLFKFTHIFGVLHPEWHRLLYLYPFLKHNEWLLPLIMSILSPFLILSVTMGIVWFYFAMWRSAKADSDQGDLTGAIGHYALMLGVGALHITLMINAPSLM